MKRQLLFPLAENVIRTTLSIRTFHVALVALASCSGLAATAAMAESKIFDVREFGASGDGKTADTEAIQHAIDLCGEAGGGIVRLPAGTYLSKPLVLRNKTTLQLDEGARLLGTGEPEDFTRTNKINSFVALINGKDVTNIVITGKGTIDGAGARWWQLAAEARMADKGYTLPRPRMIVLTRCKGVRVSGVTLQNSPSSHLAPVDCENLMVQDVIFNAPTNSFGTDGIEVSQCRRVTITGCVMDVAGEGVIIKSSRPMPGREVASENLTVTNCAFRHGKGLSIGGETMGGIRNVTIRNCTLEGTDAGLHIKSGRNKGGTVDNVLADGLTMKQVRRGLIITCYNAGIPKTDPGEPVGEWTPVFRNIRIRNVNASTAGAAGLIVGLPESEVNDVSLENVQIAAGTTGLQVRNAKGVFLRNVRITPKRGKPVILQENAEVQSLQTEK